MAEHPIDLWYDNLSKRRRFLDLLKGVQRAYTDFATAAARRAPRVDALCGTTSGNEAWDARIETTHEKHAGVLAVLRHPVVPWHTHAAERG